MNNKELHKIAPTLSKLKDKRTGFKVPDSYFNNLEQHLVAETSIYSSTKGAAKTEFNTPKEYFETVEDTIITNLKAEKLQSNKSLEVPENYFNTVENTIIERLKSEQKVPKVISLQQKIRKLWIPVAIAASLLLVFTLTTNSKSNSFDTIATIDIENWIENGHADIDAYQLATIYNDIEIDDNFIAESISEGDLIDYLNEENIEQLILEN